LGFLFALLSADLGGPRQFGEVGLPGVIDAHLPTVVHGDIGRV
jgi:hypothetical protein